MMNERIEVKGLVKDAELVRDLLAREFCNVDASFSVLNTVNTIDFLSGICAEKGTAKLLNHYRLIGSWFTLLFCENHGFEAFRLTDGDFVDILMQNNNGEINIHPVGIILPILLTTFHDIDGDGPNRIMTDIVCSAHEQLRSGRISISPQVDWLLDLQFYGDLSERVGFREAIWTFLMKEGSTLYTRKEPVWERKEVIAWIRDFLAE